MSTKTDDIKIRIASDDKDTIEQAADALDENVSTFVRVAAMRRASEIIADLRPRQVTVMPPESFDALYAALDDPGEPSPRFLKAAEVLGQLDLD